MDHEDYLPIKVVVIEGKEDITIKISNEGGRISRSAIMLILTYMYMMMENQGIEDGFQASDFKAPMAGFGYGLPLSRLVSVCISNLCMSIYDDLQYVGGDLHLIVMDSFGMDVYIHLNRLSSNWEPLL